MKKQFLILFAFISVLTFGQVPQRFNKVIVTGDIISPKYIKTGSTADSVLLGNGSARAISTIKTDTVSLSNRINAKATGNGIANGTNTGDETLTSIKTKLGAATSVSDGYLKYQDWSIFNSKEPAITKNTAFNKNFGTTSGTVLEGRTFGTAANSAIGDFIQNQNASAQSANIWIGGQIRVDNAIASQLDGSSTVGAGARFGLLNSAGDRFMLHQLNASNGEDIWSSDGTLYRNVYSLSYLGAATFASTVNSTGFLLNGNNLTSSLTTNYIPKWNGSSFVNGLISDDGSKVQVYRNINADILLTDGTLGTSYGGMLRGYGTTGSGGGVKLGTYDGGTFYPWVTVNAQALTSSISGIVNFTSTTPSTAPTNGALVVGGGVGAAHVRANQFYGNGSNLTGVQLPITLTTNGTSGVATFSGNVLNVPNYAASGGVNQTQTTVNGSTSGNMVCSMPFQTGSYKKVIVTLHSLTGTATYTYPVAFSDTGSNIYAHGTSGASYAVYSDRVEFFGASSSFGCLIIEGY